MFKAVQYYTWNMWVEFEMRDKGNYTAMNDYACPGEMHGGIYTTRRLPGI